MAEYFFELLTEEIPASMHEAAQNALRAQLTELLVGSGGEPQIYVSTTSRRIIFFLSGLPLREPDREEEVKGPPRKSAYDAAGASTRALQGFLKKHEATEADVLEGGEYVRIRRRISGRGFDSIL